MTIMELFPFQRRILEQTAGLSRVAYYLDMGLGKTFIGAAKAIQLGQRILVVCQKSKVADWVGHFARVCGVDAMDLTLGRSSDAWVERWRSPVPGVGVINYDLAFRRPQLLKLDGFTLVLDESSKIQNPKAKRTKFIMKMKPANVILLSGTPTSGKYENLWSQLNLIGWAITQRAYHQQYVNWKTIEAGGFPLKVVDKGNPYKNVDRLKGKMREHGAVFLKTNEVFELPECTFIEKRIPATEEYRRFQKAKAVAVAGDELIGDTPLTFRLCSRMLCGHLNPAKLDAFRDLCESTNDRLVVFYNFNAELVALSQIAIESGKPVSEVSGRKKDLSAYEAEDDSVTLVQYQAGAMGLNLQKSNKAIYFTPTEMSELFEQSKKRIHRIGQEKPCFYYILICEDSVEDKEILPMLGLRKELSDDLFIR
jgi:hypothetical protein